MIVLILGVNMVVLIMILVVILSICIDCKYGEKAWYLFVVLLMLSKVLIFIGLYFTGYYN